MYKEVLKTLNEYLDEALKDMSHVQNGYPGQSEEYLQGRIDTLAQAIRFVNSIKDTTDIKEIHQLATEAKIKYGEDVRNHLEFPHTETDLHIRCMGYEDGFVDGYKSK